VRDVIPLLNACVNILPFLCNEQCLVPNTFFNLPPIYHCSFFLCIFSKFIWLELHILLYIVIFTYVSIHSVWNVLANSIECKVTTQSSITYYGHMYFPSGTVNLHHLFLLCKSDISSTQIWSTGEEIWMSQESGGCKTSKQVTDMCGNFRQGRMTKSTTSG